MSKIGRKPIKTANVKVEVNGKAITIKGTKQTFEHELPDFLSLEFQDDAQAVKLVSSKTGSDANRLWGLNRALLANKIQGAGEGFEQKLIITGLGYKGIPKGNEIEFALGYSHKITMPIPEGITIEFDKTGQRISVKGSDREAVGHVSDTIRSLRPPEPYKGTGIKLEEETIIRKAGKAKS